MSLTLHLSTCLPTYLPVHLCMFLLSLLQPFCLDTYLDIYLSIYLSIYLCTYLSNLSMYLSIHFSSCLPIYPSIIHSSIHLFVCLSNTVIYRSMPLCVFMFVRAHVYAFASTCPSFDLCIWVVVRIMVFFGVLSQIRHLVFREPQRER